VLAAAITWVAFGPGERRFSGSLPLTGNANEFAGRGLFGFGAAMMWLAVLVILSSWRKTPGRGRKS
jgi:hypothetical protein